MKSKFLGVVAVLAFVSCSSLQGVDAPVAWQPMTQQEFVKAMADDPAYKAAVEKDQAEFLRSFPEFANALKQRGITTLAVDETYSMSKDGVLTVQKNTDVTPQQLVVFAYVDTDTLTGSFTFVTARISGRCLDIPLFSGRQTNVQVRASLFAPGGANDSREGVGFGIGSASASANASVLNFGPGTYRASGIYGTTCPGSTASKFTNRALTFLR